MGKVLQCLTDKEESFIAKQKVFFLASAPLSPDHHVNVSPKAPGGSSLVVLDPRRVAYLDLTGSGAETAAHILQPSNGRMTLMFCNLESGPPAILRLFGKADLIVKEEATSNMLSKFPLDLTSNPGFRGIFVLHIDRISSSCGYSMPVMRFERYRKTLDEFMAKHSPNEQVDYCIRKNSFSIDGLDSLAQARFKDKTIVLDPRDGYFFGKLLDHGEKKRCTSAPRTTPKSESLKLLLMGISIFAAGIAVGIMVPVL